MKRNFKYPRPKSTYRPPQPTQKPDINYAFYCEYYCNKILNSIP